MPVRINQRAWKSPRMSYFVHKKASTMAWKKIARAWIQAFDWKLASLTSPTSTWPIIALMRTIMITTRMMWHCLLSYGSLSLTNETPRMRDLSTTPTTGTMMLMMTTTTMMMMAFIFVDRSSKGINDHQWKWWYVDYYDNDDDVPMGILLFNGHYYNDNDDM